MKYAGFMIEHCRTNCPKAARNWQIVSDKLNIELLNMNLMKALQDKFSSINHHHIPKIALAGCPNGCSQPQIKDLSISGYVTPEISDAPCLSCQACVRSCLENAITWQSNRIEVDKTRCLACGDCLHVCPSGTITEGERGWELRFGGRVGRHPRFAESAGCVTEDDDVVTWIIETLSNYVQEGLPQERLSHFLEREKPSLFKCQRDSRS